MRASYTLRSALLCSVAFVAALPASAQDIIEGDAILLDEILLKKSKRDIKTDTATSETKIGQEEIDDRQATTIAELVDSVPGVTLVNGNTPTGSGINIRGFGANGTFGTDQKVLIQIDGASVGGEELYRIGTQLFTDPALYKSVRVLRGMGGSFEYGSGAVGGVVQLETKDASDFTGGEVGFRFRQTLQGSTNGSGLISSSIFAWQPTDNTEFLANYVYNTSKEYKDGDGNVVPNTDFTMPSLLLKGTAHFGEDRAHSVTLSYSDSTLEEFDVPYDAIGGNPAFGNVDRKFDTQQAVAKYRFNPSDNDLVDVEVVLSYADQFIEQSSVSGSGSSLYRDTQYETTKLLFKNTAAFSAGSTSHDLRTGVEFSNRSRLNQGTSAPGGNDQRLALFIVDEIDFGNGLTLTPGLRFEDQKLTGDITDAFPGSYNNSALMGGISAFYQFDSGWGLFGSAGYTVGMPPIDDLGNPTYATQPEKATNYEVGVSYANTGVFTDLDTVGFKLTAYKTHLWDVTSYVVPGTFSTPIDTVDLHGFELEALYSMDNGFYTDVNANIQRAKYFSTAAGGSGFWENIPADQLRLTLGKRFGNEIDLSWEVIATAKMDRTTTPSASHLINNVRATYRPQAGAFEGTEIRFGIENLFDVAYQPHLAERAAAGRTFKLSLAKTF
ncbi:TonB-dependent receptor domain-containing protein [Shimia haliotis]|uniref:Hemoglobin/transferrin/lactoferrin receptor protein n=1 Tax=Shimia haliotis TaxID=1280847 RepID=A0A1I4C5F8_9RHOB|nr:TonB-dependent receptor [Shimia haliotis]SFK75341.1 hemoglobin/transferrin/lactoferrin receptor protein [Shimia haliotis]